MTDLEVPPGTAPRRGRASRSPLIAGIVLAIGAAVTFGVTAPIVGWASRDAGALATACLLYAGAALGAAAAGVVRNRGWSLGRGDLRRVGLIALLGAAIAPCLLVWGLHRTGALTASLLLNLEAVFTVVLAVALHRELIGRRVWVAVALMAAGGAALSLDAATHGTRGLLGALAVAGATLAWAADNTLTQPLSVRDPRDVVAAKGALGAMLTAAVALATSDRWPGARDTAVLLACGMTGYGASLGLYILAQRRIGAARTGSVFALAPFIGALAAWFAGERALGLWALVALALFLLGVWLHLTEQHLHPHRHRAVEHAHPHRHDDDHHLHTHDPPVTGEHTHLHVHAPHEHDHLHGHDAHHAHDHEH